MFDVTLTEKCQYESQFSLILKISLVENKGKNEQITEKIRKITDGQ